MSSISDEIKGIILKTLPSLTEDIQKRVITALESSGVESVEDLKYVQQDDIKIPLASYTAKEASGGIQNG